MKGALGIACVAMSLMAAAALAPAQGPEASGKIIPGSGDSRLDDSVRAISSQLRCPVCQGESIQESPAELAKEMRAVVREQLAAGRVEQ